MAVWEKKKFTHKTCMCMGIRFTAKNNCQHIESFASVFEHSRYNEMNFHETNVFRSCSNERPIHFAAILFWF